MSADTKDSTPSKGKALHLVLRDKAFLVAVVILVASGLGWAWMVEAMNWALSKEPCPWPEPVAVDADFRLDSFPDRVKVPGGVYESVTQDVRTEGGRKLYYWVPGRPDVLPEDLMDALKIGTTMDKMNRPKRMSNWYMVRFYRDNRRGTSVLRSPYHLWRVEVYYYTGSADTVPHVPEICMTAGGASDIRGGNVPLDLQLPPDSRWKGTAFDGKVEFRRTVYRRQSKESMTSHQGAEYYVFSINGKPETDRLRVRAGLASPLVKHCYFAKIQFSPIGAEGITDLAECDRQAETFANEFMPRILASLPTPADIRRLDKGE